MQEQETNSFPELYIMQSYCYLVGGTPSHEKHNHEKKYPSLQDYLNKYTKAQGS